jgi:hypothetical protein
MLPPFYVPAVTCPSMGRSGAPGCTLVVISSRGFHSCAQVDITYVSLNVSLSAPALTCSPFLDTCLHRPGLPILPRIPIRLHHTTILLKHGGSLSPTGILHPVGHHPTPGLHILPIHLDILHIHPIHQAIPPIRIARTRLTPPPTHPIRIHQILITLLHIHLIPTRPIPTTPPVERIPILIISPEPGPPTPTILQEEPIPIHTISLEPGLPTPTIPPVEPIPIHTINPPAPGHLIPAMPLVDTHPTHTIPRCRTGIPTLGSLLPLLGHPHRHGILCRITPPLVGRLQSRLRITHTASVAVSKS